MSRLLITGSRNHQWTPYDSHALLIAVREILEKTHELPILVHGGATGGNLKPCDTGGDTLIPKIAMGVYYWEHPILH